MLSLVFTLLPICPVSTTFIRFLSFQSFFMKINILCYFPRSSSVRVVGDWWVQGRRTWSVHLSLASSKWSLFSEDTKLYIWLWNMNQIPEPELHSSWGSEVPFWPVWMGRCSPSRKRESFIYCFLRANCT